MNLNRRSAIVTGGAGGLGAATVRRLVSCGMQVAVFDRDVDRSRSLGHELGGASLVVSGDVNDDDDVGAAIDRARSLGRLSVLANVAGGAVGGVRIVGRTGTAHDKASFARTMSMNAIGTFNVVRLVASAKGRTKPTTMVNAGYWSTRLLSRASRGRAGRWPTAPQRRRSWG